MKKIFAYITVCVAIVATGCTTFEDEKSLTLPDPPAVNISGISAESEAISFKVAPAGVAGYYAWLVVEGEEVDSTLQALPILRQTATGLAKGIAEYAKTSDSLVVVDKLTPYTVYQIYAVTSSTDGVVSTVHNTSIRTLDDGGKPAPTDIGIADTTVTITFHEPLQRGTGKVYVSYFAKNTVSGDNPLVIEAGYEEFNPQDIEVEEDRLSVSGSTLVVKLPSAPAGAYASITYDTGAVLDLEGNASNPYVRKADTLVSGVPSRGLTARVATKTWGLESEAEALELDTPIAFSAWDELEILALPDSGITVRKKGAEIPTFAYKEPGKTITLDAIASGWGVVDGIPTFLLPEEPNFGATVDLNIPAEAFEDVYGNTNEALSIEDNYLYSYGYTLDDLLGTWQINGINASTGAPIAPETVIIADDPESDDENDVFITGLGKNITGVDAAVSAVFNPVFGTLTVPDWQVLAPDWTHPTAGIADVLFITYSSPAIVFAVTSPGNITSSSDIWGYGLGDGDDYIGAMRWYATSTTWERTSTTTASQQAALSSAINNDLPLLDTTRKHNR